MRRRKGKILRSHSQRLAFNDRVPTNDDAVMESGLDLESDAGLGAVCRSGLAAVCRAAFGSVTATAKLLGSGLGSDLVTHSGSV